jgi:mycolipenoyl-CoA---2-(long-chain-fatty acyl)-trehalose mycolipenoyltransferase / long-chain-acyl-CoA---trehalose acyltransferase
MVAVGKVTLATVDTWVPVPGSVTRWRFSSASLEKARQAPISAVPPSYIQARHIRNYRDHLARGLNMSRLCVAAWDIPGQCDVRAMTYVINSYLRRHDTYRSWFEFNDEGDITRRTILDPRDIELVPDDVGPMTPTEWQNYILTTPSPLEWDCFRFAIIQRDDHFTVSVSVDHLHVDAMFIYGVFGEIQAMYDALVDGGAPIALPQAGSYDAYCVREHEYTSSLTVESPQIATWIEFFENNAGALPPFALPLGDTTRHGDRPPCGGELRTVQLLNAAQTAEFEAACLRAGARLSGGVFACAALTEHELTGTETYYGITPIDTRTTPAEFMTTGWFVGHVPLSIPIGPTFAETVGAAQASYDAGTDLANIPFERVLELAPWLEKPQTQAGFPILSFLDAGVAPLSAFVTMELDRLNAGVYEDGGIPARVCLWVNRLPDETSVTAFLPDNPVARESVTRYLAVMKSIYVRIAEGRNAVRAPGARHSHSGHSADFAEGKPRVAPGI